MLTRIVAVSTLVLSLVICALSSATLLGQQSPATSATVEFPVIMQQSITAGKTSAGTKIRAKLEVPTLLNGTVIPKNAVFSGEVVDSAAKTATTPSRLALRIDSVEWKAGTAPVKLYLTRWYYPTMSATGQDLQYGPTLPANRTWNGQGQYPDPNSKAYKPFPGSDSNKDSPVPDTPSPVTADHRVAMKDVETARSEDGAIYIVCKRSNIKLDKLTIYVLSGDGLLPAK